MNNKTPKLRFKGFTDAWEQRKLGNKMYIKSRIGWQALTKSEYLETGDYYLITGTDIDEDNHVVDLKRCCYVSKERYEMDDKIQVHEGDIIVTKDGTIGKVAMVTGLDKPATLNSHLFVLRDMSGTLDNRFLLQVLSSHIFDDFVESTKTGSTLTGLPQKTFVEFKFSAPKIDEQKKISGFLDNIDNLITLHQRKLDKLNSLKKGYLEKIFPKEGKLYPELRFTGFTDAWEQRKLGDLVERITRKNANLESNLPLTISAQYGLIDQNEFFDKRIASKDVSGYYLIKKGEFAYNKSTSSDAEWGAIKRLDRYEKGVLSTLYIVFKIINEEKLSSDFLVSYYETNLWHKGIQSIAAEGARNHGLLNIAPKDFFETTLTVPRNFVEQQKIGSFFKSLDNLITLHQRKLEKLKQLKTSYLNSMFI